MKRLRSWLKHSNYCPAPPAEISLELTSRCNLSCPQCSHSKLSRDEVDLPLDHALSVIDQCAGQIEYISLCNCGEPLLYQGLITVIKRCSALGLKASISTNLMLLDEETSKILLESGLWLIIFSLDAVKPDIYSRIRVGGDFSKAEENARRFLEIKRKSGSRTLVFAQMVCGNDNREETKEFIKRWTIPGIDRVRIKPRAPLRDTPGLPPPVIPCVMPWRMMAILSDGRVTACCNDIEGFYILGDVRNEKIADIWNGQKMMEFRNLHSDGSASGIRPCLGCPWLSKREPFQIISFLPSAADIRRYLP